MRCLNSTLIGSFFKGKCRSRSLLLEKSLFLYQSCTHSSKTHKMETLANNGKFVFIFFFSCCTSGFVFLSSVRFSNRLESCFFGISGSFPTGWPWNCTYSCLTVILQMSVLLIKNYLSDACCVQVCSNFKACVKSETRSSSALCTQG